MATTAKNATATAATTEAAEEPAPADAPAPEAAAAGAGTPNNAGPAPEPHSSDDDSFFGSESEEEGEDEDDQTLAGGGAFDEKEDANGAAGEGDKLSSAQLARRRLRAVRRLHAAYARQARVLMGALQEKTRRVRAEEEEEEGKEAAEGEKKGGDGDKKEEDEKERRRSRSGPRPRSADFPAAARPDPLLEDGETPCADPGTISDVEEEAATAAAAAAAEREAAEKAKPNKGGGSNKKSEKSGGTKKAAAVVVGSKRRTRASADWSEGEGASEGGAGGEAEEDGKKKKQKALPPLPPPAPRRWRAALRSGLPALARLEALAAASTARELDERGALAALCARGCRFLIRSPAVALGRAPAASVASDAERGLVVPVLAAGDDGAPPSSSSSLRLLRALDADLSRAGGDARKVSRQQARVELGADGKWSLAATGRRALSVDGARLAKGERCELRHLSLVEAGGIRMLFVVNARAVRRAMARSEALGL